MKKATFIIAIGILLTTTLIGCSGEKDSGSKDEALRNNFSRPLNEEELAQMGKSDPPAPPQKGEKAATN